MGGGASESDSVAESSTSRNLSGSGERGVSWNLPGADGFIRLLGGD